MVSYKVYNQRLFGLLGSARMPLYSLYPYACFDLLWSPPAPSSQCLCR